MINVLNWIIIYLNGKMCEKLMKYISFSGIEKYVRVIRKLLVN